jgi:hypothetical protein
MVLREHPTCQPETGADGLFSFLAEVLDRAAPRRGIRPGRCHWGYYRIRPQGPDTFDLAFDSFSFLDAFAVAHIAPRSPVHIRLPQAPWADDAPQWVDPVRSIFRGAARFAQRLFDGSFRLSALPQGAEDRVMMPDRFGWWNDWFELLFTRSADLELEFDWGGKGLRLKRSRLGRARLGRGEDRRTMDLRPRF